MMGSDADYRLFTLTVWSDTLAKQCADRWQKTDHSTRHKAFDNLFHRRAPDPILTLPDPIWFHVIPPNSPRCRQYLKLFNSSFREIFYTFAEINIFRFYIIKPVPFRPHETPLPRHPISLTWNAFSFKTMRKVTTNDKFPIDWITTRKCNQSRITNFF